MVMTVKIKRIAQFLFDNAELLSKFLCDSEHYRSAEVHLSVFKNEPLLLQTVLRLYDETLTSFELTDKAITKERFIQLCQRIDEDAGVVEMPEPEEVRDTLEEE